MMWLLLQLQLAFAVLPAQPVVLGEEPAIVPLVTGEDGKLSDRVIHAARAPTENVLLVLKGVEAKERPDASWEVYVQPATSAGEQGGSLVGIVSFFDQKSAEFVFAIDKAIAAAGEQPVQIKFVPTSGVVIDGAPQPATVHSPATIGEITLVIEEAETGIP